MEIKITGSSDLDTAKRKAAVEKLLKLSTKGLENLASLAESQKARGYIEDPLKFKTLKTFL